MIYTHQWTEVRDQERKLRKIWNVDLVGARLRLGKFCGGAVLGKGELGERGGYVHHLRATSWNGRGGVWY